MEIGVVVRLKSGSSMLTITHKSSPSDNGDERVEVTWFDANKGGFLTQIVPVSALVIIPDNML